MRQGALIDELADTMNHLPLLYWILEKKTKGEIIIENLDLTTLLSLEIINMKGQIIKFTRYNILKTQDLGTGVYILKIATKHGSYLRKISLFKLIAKIAFFIGRSSKSENNFAYFWSCGE